MKFIVSSTSLLKHLQKISGVLNSSNTLPILDNFLFNIDENSLKISASDLETTMITSLTIDSKSKGEIAIPAKLVMEILKNFPEQPLIFDISSDDFGIDISSDYGKYKLSGYSAEEFPNFPVIEQPSQISIAAKSISTALNKTSFATGNDELRPVMCGVFCELNQDNITFVATDAHKLVKYKRTDIGSEVGTSFIIPNKPLNILKNLSGSSDNELSIEYNQTNAHFKIDDVELICRFVNGKYPNYEAVIPKENPNVLTIDKSLLLSSLKRVSIFSNKSTYYVQLAIAGSKLEISAEDMDFSNKANEVLTCSYVGEDITIGFNSKFLIEVLNNIDSDEISLKMSTPNKAGIIVPTTPKDDQEDLMMLVMPVMI